MHGQISLGWAAENSHWEVVQLLLAAHAEVVDSKDDMYGRTPFVGTESSVTHISNECI